MSSRSTANTAYQTDISLSAASLYTNLLARHPGTVHEKGGYGYAERHLQCVWADAGLRPDNLTTLQGEKVTVINPGRWNSEAGPDFLDAMLKINPGNRCLKGDIEIHISPSDWHAHHHASDPRFKNIIAHVTYLPPAKPLTTLPPGTIEIALQQPLASNPAFSFEAIDLTAYPYTPFPSRNCPCAAVLRDWQPDEIGAMLESAGAHRLQTKAQRIRGLLTNANHDQVLCSEIFAALGYKHNSAIFRLLIKRVSPAMLAELSPLAAYSLLLGIAGLVPAKTSPRWDDETKLFIRKIWDSWWQQQDYWQNAIIPKKLWQLSSIRPQNHPIRRLAAATAFVCHPQPPTARVSGLIDAIRATPDRKKIPDRVAGLFLAPPPIDYWHRHISLASPRRDKPLAIVGKARAAAIYTNVILPFMAATGGNISTLIHAIPPEQNNTIIRQTAYALLGPDHNPVIYNQNGLRQQGLIQIFHDFCLPDRSGCHDCPLPRALQKQHRNF